MDMDMLLNYMPYVVSGVTGLLGWIVGKKRSDNSFISELQDSINLLAKDNKELREELIAVRKEYANQSVLLEKIRLENLDLKEQLNILTLKIK
ncbi:MAG: hypothetical protein RSE41_04065 [Clostridia bacterium]